MQRFKPLILIAILMIIGFVGVVFMNVIYLFDRFSEPVEPIIAPPIEVVLEPLGASIERAWNRNTTQVGDTKTSTFHLKWINYLGETEWNPIDTDFTATTGGFEMTEAPFEVFVPEYADGTATFFNNNRFDLATKSIIDEASFDMFITAQGVGHIQGQVVTGDLNVSVGFQPDLNYVVYEDAYGAGIDLIYYVHFGRQPRLEKLVRFDAKPTIFEYVFEIGVGETVEITRKDLNGVYKEWKNRKKKEPFSGSEKLEVKRNDNRGAYFAPFQIWDSNRDYEAQGTSTPRNIEVIDIELTVASPTSVYLTKILPEAFFDTATYPVYTDTESTFDEGETTMDGRSGFDGESAHTWTQKVNDTEAVNPAHTSYNGTACHGYVGDDNRTSNRGWLYRAFFIYDTSSIGSDTVESPTTFVLQTNGQDQDDLGLSADSNETRLVTVAPASDTVLDRFDYDLVGDGSTPLANDIEDATIGTVASTEITFTLIQAGYDHIESDTTTRIGTRHMSDINDEEPSAAASDYAGAVWRCAGYAGTSEDPVLTITHSASAGGAVYQAEQDIIWFNE